MKRIIVGVYVVKWAPLLIVVRQTGKLSLLCVSLGELKSRLSVCDYSITLSGAIKSVQYIYLVFMCLMDGQIIMIFV